MSSIIKQFTKFLSNPEFQPLLEKLKEQNDQFTMTETAKLLMESESDDSDVIELFDDDEEEEEVPDKDMAMSALKKISKLFEYSSIQDKVILLVGTVFTIIHASSFPILAILFGKISNAYIAHKLQNLGNTTLYPPQNNTNETDATGNLALSFLTKVTSKVSPGTNASIIPTADEVNGPGYFGDINLYHSTGNETLDDFAQYVRDFSLYYIYIGFAVFVASFFQTLCWEWAAENQLYRIKEKYLYQLVRQEMSWFGQKTAGALVLKIADDCEKVRDGIGQKFSLVLEYTTIAMFGAGIGLLTNVKLTLVFLACTPFILAKLYLVWKKMARKSASMQKRYGKAGKICSEVLSGVRTVAACTSEEKEVNRYSRALSRGVDAAKNMEMLTGIGIGGMYLLIYCFYALALWYAVNMLSQGTITPGEIYTIFFSITICAFAMGSLLPFIDSTASAFASIRILGEVLDSMPSIDPYSFEGDQPKNFTGRIKFSNVTFAYPGREETPVFNDLRLEIPAGGYVAIVGPCSAGKSTLIKLILRFYDVQKGRVRLDNNDVKLLNVRWIRENVSAVEQKAVLFDGTILNNIRGHKQHLKMQHVIRASKLAFAHDFIMALPDGYMTRVRLPGGKEFTTAQRQKICLARSILLNPKVLILDDTISTLDFSEGVEFRESLRNLRKNLTTIIISNKVMFAKDADTVYFLKDGNIIEKGSHEELLKLKGAYYQMFQFEDLVNQLHRDQRSPSADSTTDTEFDAERGMARSCMVVKAEAVKSEIMDADFKKAPSATEILGIVPDKAMNLCLGLLGCLISGLIIPVLALCLSRILEMFLGDPAKLFSSGIFWVEVLIGLAVLSGVGYWLRTVFIGIVKEKLVYNLRLTSFEAILRQPISWFDVEKHNTELLYARLASDIPIIKNGAGPTLANAISSSVTMGTGLIIAIIYGWEVGIVAFLIIPILFAGFFAQKYAQKKSYKIISSFKKSSSKAGQKRAIFYSLAYAVSECLMFITFGLAFRFGAEVIRSGELPIPNLFTVFFVITFGSFSLGQAIIFLPEYFRARLSATFLFKLLKLKSPIDPYDKEGLQPAIVGNIEFRNVAFSYPTTPNIKILHGLNLTVPAGNSIGIVGAMGGGKSTILNVLERFYETTKGEVLIDGINIKDINVKYLRQNIGYVSQEPNLFDMTIRENIVYGYSGDATDDELRTLVEKAAMAADADFITEELPEQFETECGEHGRNLNTGQRQEIAIARAIIKNPPILLFDDPTSELDAEEEKYVNVAMHKATEGRTCLIVSNAYAAIKYCDYVAVLAKGKIVEFGKQADLLESKGFYYNFALEQGVEIGDGEVA